ncbi:hypothetical protein D9757_009277 [Collybiopsis confluens]|uniref:Histone H4 n=1 Tax=Collybiopsis confluens TaxID=2823264 RepID=A0A8H5HA51_9AGAR|nr:hypothetical protein D9757_009277 [Collybiopsis confluens]
MRRTLDIMGARQIASTTLTGITLLMFPPVLSENGAPVLPSPGKVLDSALATHCDVLIVVPAFIEAWAQDESLIESLRTFKSICYGGGPLSPEVGNMLSEKGVNLLTMYGITEIGVMAMALPLRPSAEGWDWWRICPRLDIELPRLDDDPTIFRLIVKESNTNALAVSNLEIDGIRAYDTKDLAIRHPTNPNLFKLLGRLEFILQRDPRIKVALMFGRSKFQPGVLIVPSDEFAFNSSDLTRVAEFREAIWETVEKANEYAPQHSKIFKEACTWFARTLIFNDPLAKLILIANPDKPLEYTAKGTPRRQFCINLYETEIEHLYRTFEDSAAEDSITLDTPAELNSKAVWTHESIKSFVRQVVCQAIGNEALPGQVLSDDDNLFVMGGDSLAATYIRNSVVRALKTHFPESGVPVGMVTSTDFVYGSPSINLLSAFVFGFAAAASHSFMGREHHIKAVTEPVQDESVQPDESSEASTFEWPKKFNQPGDTVLRVREGRGEPPLIVIHGASGNPDPFIPFQENFKTGLWLVQVTTDTPRSSLREHARFYFQKIKASLLVFRSSDRRSGNLPGSFQELRPKGPYRLAAYSSGHFLACILAELFRLSGDRVDQLAFLDHYPTIFLSPLAIKSQITPENFPACVHDGSIMDPAFRLFFKRFAFLEVADTLDHEVPSRGWFMRGLMDAWEGKPSAEGIKNVAKSIERYLDECLDFAAELPGYVSSTDSRLPVQRALDAVEDWLRSPETGLGEIPRIDMFVGTYGAAVALPEEMRRECVTSGLGATHVHPNVKITEVNCGHVTILSSKEGLGKGGAKRHRKILRDNIQGITKPAIRRLARRGGVKRISGLIYEETRGVLKIFLENVIRDSVTYTEHAKRKTVIALDVVYALKRSGRTLYGFGA